MPTIVGILTFMGRINFVLSRVEHGKSFITSGPGLTRLNHSSTKQGLMCLTQEHNPQPFDLESSTLPLSHCTPVLLNYTDSVKHQISLNVCQGFMTKFKIRQNLRGNAKGQNLI